MRGIMTAALLSGVAVFLAGGLAGAAGAATLVLKVTGLSAVEGLLHYAVYDRAENFATRNGRIAIGEPKVTGKTMTIRVPGLKPGTYAIAIFHDKNANDEFDQGLFGIPLEDYAFSNNASGFFSAPSFEAASFKLAAPETRITIRIDD
jgi:uncharacterized protein (DUF2141 family)